MKGGEIVTDVHVQTLLRRTNHRELKIEAIDKDISLQKLLREIILKHLTNEGGKKNG